MTITKIDSETVRVTETREYDVKKEDLERMKNEYLSKIAEIDEKLNALK